MGRLRTELRSWGRRLGLKLGIARSRSRPGERRDGEVKSDGKQEEDKRGKEKDHIDRPLGAMTLPPKARPEENDDRCEGLPQHRDNNKTPIRFLGQS